MSSNDVSWLDMILSKAGFSSGQLPMAAAIVQAESSINPLARNPSGATGLFQIMPATARGAGYDPALLTDPLYNAQAAYAISNRGTNWSPWQTFWTGAYRRFLGGSATAGTGPGGNPGRAAGAGTAGRRDAPGGTAPAVAAGGQHQGGDWGALWSRIVAKFWRIVVAYAGLGVLASYGLTRPLAWAIVAIALLARVGGLGPGASDYVSKLFSGG